MKLSADKMEEGKQLSRQQVQMQVVSKGSASTTGGGRTVSSQLAAHHSSVVGGNASRTSLNPLTREMIISKHKLKSADLSSLKNVNLCLFEIDSLAVLRELPNLEIVSLSHNKVSSLKDLSYCSKL